MCAEKSERGAALAAVLLAMAVLLPLGALAVMQTRTGLLIQQSLRSDVEALHAAEAGLACAIAKLDPAVDLERLPLGADGVGGTGDDGTLPFALDCPLPAAAEVRIEAAGPQSAILVATGRSSKGAVRVLERRLRRTAPGPFQLAAWRER